MKLKVSVCAFALFWCALTVCGQDVAPWQDISPSGAIDTNSVTYAVAEYPSDPSEEAVETSPSPSTNFNGLGDLNTTIPPDTHGAVGPSHVMTMLNTQVRIQDRSGLTNILTKTTFDWWTNAGTYTGVFDSKVVYDPYQNRWIATACADQKLATSAILLAVSQTSDPSGSWYYQKIDADSNNLLWADYPSIGFNKTWIAVSFNIFTNASPSGFSHSRIYVFDKMNAYTNGTTRTMISNASTLGATIVPAITFDNSVSTLYCLQEWNNKYTNYASQVKGQLRLYTITGTAGAALLTPTANYPETSGWAAQADTANFAPQTGSSVKISNNDSRLQNVIYRSNFLFTVQTVFYPHTAPTRSSIQWWQIATSGAVQQVGTIDDQAGVNYHAFPSIGVNKFLDVLIGYSSFSSSRHASAEYSFHAFSDNINTMRTKVTLKEGLDIYYKQSTSGRNRWGDFSATMVDPANDTDFWTVQEYAADAIGDVTANGSGRFGVWWGKVVASTPANNDFANATTLTNWHGTNISTLFRATKEADESYHAGDPGKRSIWFNWTPATNGWVSFDTLSSTNEIDTMIGVYTGSTVSSNSLTTIAPNDDYRFRPRSFVYFNATAGTTYHIAVDAKDASVEVPDIITLIWNQSVPPKFAAEPFDKDILAGDTLILTSVAIGQPAPTYQWKTNNVNISGATFANYTNTNPQSATTNAPTAYDYTVVASNSSGSLTSGIAKVTVYPSATAIMDGLAYLTGDKFRFTVTGIPGYNYIVQGTTDYTNWVSLTTNTSSFSYTNIVSTNYPIRFFRSIY